MIAGTPTATSNDNPQSCARRRSTSSRRGTWICRRPAVRASVRRSTDAGTEDGVEELTESLEKRAEGCGCPKKPPTPKRYD